MKKKAFLLIILLLLLIPIIVPLNMVGCTPQTRIDFTNGDNTSQVNLHINGELVIIRDENLSTGFSWTYTISDPSILKLTNQDTIWNWSSCGAAGAPGKRAWTFKALNAGIAIILFNYSQQWEGGQRYADYPPITVTVK
jgi:predicted secreted protein